MVPARNSDPERGEQLTSTGSLPPLTTGSANRTIAFGLFPGAVTSAMTGQAMARLVAGVPGGAGRVDAGGPGTFAGGPGTFAGGPGTFAGGPGGVTGGPGVLVGGRGVVAGGPGLFVGGRGVVAGGPGLFAGGAGVGAGGAGAGVGAGGAGAGVGAGGAGAGVGAGGAGAGVGAGGAGAGVGVGAGATAGANTTTVDVHDAVCLIASVAVQLKGVVPTVKSEPEAGVQPPAIGAVPPLDDGRRVTDIGFPSGDVTTGEGHVTDKGTAGGWGPAGGWDPAGVWPTTSIDGVPRVPPLLYD